MNKRVAELINDQINKEFYSAYLYLEFANYYDFNMSDARKKDLENIKASLEQQIADYTGSDKDENNKNVG